MLLDTLMKETEFAAPCSADWSKMSGDEKKRFCGDCKLHVYNAEAMTDIEVLEALSRVIDGAKVCLRVYRRADGTFLTQDCPVGLERLRERALDAYRTVAAWVSGVLALFLALPVAADPAKSPFNHQGNRFMGAPMVFRQDVQRRLPAKAGPLRLIPHGPDVDKKNALRALSIVNAVPEANFPGRLEKRIAVLEEALQLSVSTEDWAQATWCCSDLVNAYSVESTFEKNPVKAKFFAEKMNEYGERYKLQRQAAQLADHY